MIKGFGGIFWRTKNLEGIKKWCSDALKIEIENWNGTVIKPDLGNETILSFFAENDSYFPTEQQVMLNFQVHINSGITPKALFARRQSDFWPTFSLFNLRRAYVQND